MSTHGATHRANRLVNESSPYLRQHAYNPVDWYPWGNEAFDKARTEDKPIFLSVGYSTCRWCHVMERESFEDEDVAKMMNDVCVNIKVDREVLPDVDRVYMTYIQATSGRGGWPMSVWLTPDTLYPFFGGTYFPPETMTQLLRQIKDKWKNDRDRLVHSANNVRSLIIESTSASSSSSSTYDALELKKKTLSAFEHSFDKKEGGFGGAPKFPTESIFSFLHTYASLHPNDSPLKMSGLTLTKMARGGIHDQLGLGFHRYSVDGVWHIPHFEIMLYDNAQLITHYLTYYALTGETYYADVARGILQYVNHNLLSPGKAYMSAEDAESYEHEGDDIKQEGAFYVWTNEQITTVLGVSDAKIFMTHFGVREDGNVDPQHDPHGELEGKNVLMEQRSVEETARKLGKDVAEVNETLERGRVALYKERQKRPKPHLDDKVLTSTWIIASWNGMMLKALAHAALILGENSWYEQGQQIIRFLSEEMIHDDNLLRCVGTSVEGVADDYACVVSGLLDMYQVKFNSKYLELAIHLQQKHDELFWDEEAGGYFASAAHSDASKIMRLKDDQDGAEPSANSVSLHNLVKLDAIMHATDPALLGLSTVPPASRDAFASHAARLIQGFGGTLSSHPHSMPELVAGAMLLDVGLKAVIVRGPEVDAFVEEVRGRKWWPDVVFVREREEDKGTSGRVCFGGTCGMPIRNAEMLRDEIERLRAPQRQNDIRV